MAVLGVKFDDGGFSAKRQRDNQAAKIAPFKDALNTADKWVKNRKEARESKTQQEFDNKMAEARESRLKGAAEDAKATSKLTFNNLVIKTEAEKLKRENKKKADTDSTMRATSGAEKIDSWTSGESIPTSGDIADIRSQGATSTGLEGETDLKVNAARAKSFEESNAFKTQSEGIAKLTEANKKGYNIHATSKEAESDSHDGLYAVAQGISGEGEPAYYADLSRISKAGRSKANALINQATRSGEGASSLSQEDEAYLLAAGEVDPDIQERINDMAKDTGVASRKEDTEDRVRAHKREDFFFNKAVNEKFEILKEQRGITDAAELFELKKGITQRLSDQGAQVTRTVTESPLEGRVTRTTVKGSLSGVQTASDEAEAIGGEVSNPFATNIAPRNPKISDEQFQNMSIGFRKNIDDIDEEIVKAQIELAGTGELFGGLPDTEARLKGLEGQRETMINRAAELGIDASDGSDTVDEGEPTAAPAATEPVKLDIEGMGNFIDALN